MKEHMPSEEKLLRLIRKKKPPRAKAAQPAPKDQKKDRRKEPFDLLRQVNTLLLLLAIGIFGYLLVKYAMMDLTKTDVTGLGEETLQTADTAAGGFRPPQRKPFDVYRRELQRRDIFLPPWANPVSPQTAAPAVNLRNEFRLIGILLDKDPKAIIEDVKTRETKFVSEGESLGEAVVEKIMEDKVILRLNNQRQELTQ